MPRPLHALLSCLAVCFLLDGCKSPDPEPRLTFVAVLAIQAGNPGPTPAEETIVQQLIGRAAELAIDTMFENEDSSDGKLTLFLTAADEATARSQLDTLLKHVALELRSVHPKSSPALAAEIRSGSKSMPGFALFDFEYKDATGTTVIEPLLLGEAFRITGGYIEDAWPDPGRAGVINVFLNAEGGGRMASLTGSMNFGVDRLAILVNGEVNSAPVVNDVLSTRFVMLMPGKTPAELEALSRNLANGLANGLDAKLKLESFTPFTP